MYVRTRLGLTLLLIGIIAGCGKCGCEKQAGVEAGGPLRYMPKTAEVAVVVPDLSIVGERLAILEKLKLASFAAQLQGVADAQAFSNALMQQVGIDLRSVEAMKKAGLAPDRGLGVVLLPKNAAFLVVGVSDEKAFSDTVKRLASTRLGAREEKRTDAGNGRQLVSFSRAPDGKAELGYLIADGIALVAPGETTSRLAEFAALPREQSLVGDPQLEGSLSRLPKARDVIVHLPASAIAGAPQPTNRPALPIPLTFVGSLSPDALRLTGDAPWPDSEASLAAFEKKDGPELLTLLPKDAFFVARMNGEPAALETFWPMLVGPHLQRALNMAQVDVKKEILGNLQPGAVAALTVSPTIPLGSGMPSLDVRSTNPFRYAHLVAIAPAKDPARLSPLLSRMPEISPRFGAQIEKTETEGRTFYVTRYARGEGVHFSEVDGKVVFASPLGRLERSVQQVAAKDTSDPPALLKDEALAKVLRDEPVAFVIDLHQLADSVKALPSEAWGIGGFAIKATTVRWLDGVRDLRAITFGMHRNGKAAQAELALRFAQP